MNTMYRILDVSKDDSWYSKRNGVIGKLFISDKIPKYDSDEPWFCSISGRVVGGKHGNGRCTFHKVEIKHAYKRRIKG